MKNLIIITLIVFMGFGFASCTQEPGPGGNREINGTVTYPDGLANGASVYIYYDAEKPADNYSNVTITNEEGKFKFEGLQAGDYYIEADYTCPKGFTHKSIEGKIVRCGSKKGDPISIDLELQ